MNSGTRTGLTCVGLIGGALAAGQLVGVMFGEVPVSVLVGRGLIFGGINALVAVGLVFVYRAAKVVNFSQAGFGAVAAVGYLCLREAWGWSFWPAIGAALAVALLGGLILEVAILRRFSRAPRLVLTVVTIALGQSLLGASLSMPEQFGFVRDPDSGILILPTRAPSTPFDGDSWVWDRVTFTGNQVAIVLFTVAILAALAAFLRFTRAGTAIRGASENRE